MPFQTSFLTFLVLFSYVILYEQQADSKRFAPFDVSKLTIQLNAMKLRIYYVWAPQFSITVRNRFNRRYISWRNQISSPNFLRKHGDSPQEKQTLRFEMLLFLVPFAWKPNHYSKSYDIRILGIFEHFRKVSSKFSQSMQNIRNFCSFLVFFQLRISPKTLMCKFLEKWLNKNDSKWKQISVSV